MNMKNLPDILLRLFLGAVFVVAGTYILRYSSLGSIITCSSSESKTVSCVTTERTAFSQHIIEEKSIDNITKAKVAIIHAVLSDPETEDNSKEIRFFRVLVITSLGVSYQIGKDGQNQAEAEAIAGQINLLIKNPKAAPLQLDYSSNITNWFGFGAIGLGVIVSLFLRTERTSY